LSSFSRSCEWATRIWPTADSDHFYPDSEFVLHNILLILSK
jgi:hypothetical protein